jgi:hypothetical protein
MKRTVAVMIFASGIAAGFFGGQVLGPAVAVEAQGAGAPGWQCRSWTRNDASATDVTEVGGWLANAMNVQLTSAGLSAGSRYALVACKQGTR